MLELENGNVSYRSAVGTFLRSKFGHFTSASLQTKISLVITGLLALAAAPAAYALNNMGGTDAAATTSLSSSHEVADQAQSQSSSSSSFTSSSLNVTNNGGSSTQVTVNGQPVAVPENGSVHKIIKDDNGETVVDISTHSTNSANGNSSSSVWVYSQSSSNVQEGGVAD